MMILSDCYSAKPTLSQLQVSKIFSVELTFTLEPVVMRRHKPKNRGKLVVQITASSV